MADDQPAEASARLNVGPLSNALRPDLEYLSRAADAVERALHRGATAEAGPVLDRLLDSIDVELVARGNVAGAPALFDDLLLAAQVERELQAVKERARGSQ